MIVLLAACLSSGVLPTASVATLDAPQPGTSRLTSQEATILGAGQSLDLLTTDGSGRVERIWMTLGDPDRGPDAVNLREGRIRAYWDGGTEPAIDVPVGDFFGLGHGVGGVVQADPVQSSTRALVAYWPMPFARGARLVFTNESAADLRVFSQVTWAELPRRAISPLRFQASWRRNEVEGEGMLTVAEVRGRGHYVGTILAISPTERSWWGEGDDVYVVDGVESMGTGTEDWINQAWFSLAPQFSRAGAVNQKGRLLTLYRFHVPDVVRFEESLDVRFEQRGYAGRVRSDDVSATALWYQEPPLTPLPPLPVAAARRVTPVMPDGAWTIPGEARPIDVVVAAEVEGLPTTESTEARRLELRNVRPGTLRLAGVDLFVAERDDIAAGVLLGERPLPLPVPAGAAALYLLTTVEGEFGAPAFVVRAGDKVLPWRIGQEAELYKDPFPVPRARGVTLSEDGVGIQAAFVGALPLPAGTTRVELVAAPEARAVVWGAATGPLPADFPRGGR